LFTVVLIGISVATLAFTGYLLRCVLTAEPLGPPPSPDGPGAAGS